MRKANEEINVNIAAADSKYENNNNSFFKILNEEIRNGKPEVLIIQEHLGESSYWDFLSVGDPEGKRIIPVTVFFDLMGIEYDKREEDYQPLLEFVFEFYGISFSMKTRDDPRHWDGKTFFNRDNFLVATKKSSTRRSFWLAEERIERILSPELQKDEEFLRICRLSDYLQSKRETFVEEKLSVHAALRMATQKGVLLEKGEFKGKKYQLIYIENRDIWDEFRKSHQVRKGKIGPFKIFPYGKFREDLNYYGRREPAATEDFGASLQIRPFHEDNQGRKYFLVDASVRGNEGGYKETLVYKGDERIISLETLWQGFFIIVEGARPLQMSTDPGVKDPRIRLLDKKRFDRDDISPGEEEIGVFRKEDKPPLWENTKVHKRTVDLLNLLGRHERRSAWEDRHVYESWHKILDEFGHEEILRIFENLRIFTDPDFLVRGILGSDQMYVDEFGHEGVCDPRIANPFHLRLSLTLEERNKIIRHLKEDGRTKDQRISSLANALS